MAINLTKKFSEQAIRVERVLQRAKITASAGRVIFVLTRANQGIGVTQKEIVDGTGLAKDVVSKLIASLVKAKVLTQERESRTMRLLTSDAGKDLLSRVQASLQPLRPADTEDKVRVVPSEFTFEE
jgi:DNA-binding MarR family transcriptional regulator